MSDKITPFSNGTQFGDWVDENCWKCQKDFDEERDAYRCDIQKALDAAYVGDGTISRETAEKMGYLKHEGYYIWPCPKLKRKRE